VIVQTEAQPISINGESIVKTADYAPFARNMGIDPQQLRNLCRLADIAAIDQEEQHNTGKDSSASIAKLEAYAVALGFSVRWPGLYPVLHRDGQPFHLPE